MALRLIKESKGRYILHQEIEVRYQYVQFKIEDHCECFKQNYLSLPILLKGRKVVGRGGRRPLTFYSSFRGILRYSVSRSTATVAQNHTHILSLYSTCGRLLVSCFAFSSLVYSSCHSLQGRIYETGLCFDTEFCTFNRDYMNVFTTPVE
jgi:hypothetical protein